MGFQRNKKIYVSQRQNLQTNNKGKRSADLLKTCKQAHYHKWFEENKRYCRALWIGISKIVYSKHKIKINSLSSLIQDSKTITDQKHIAKHFNNFFTDIGKILKRHPTH